MLKQMTDEIISVSDDSWSKNLVAIIVLNLIFNFGTRDIWVSKGPGDVRGQWLLFSLVYGYLPLLLEYKIMILPILFA